MKRRRPSSTKVDLPEKDILLQQCHNFDKSRNQQKSIDFSIFQLGDIRSRLVEHLCKFPRAYTNMKNVCKDFYDNIKPYDVYYRENMDSIELTTTVFDFLFYRFVWILKNKFPNSTINYPRMHKPLPGRFIPRRPFGNMPKYMLTGPRDKFIELNVQSEKEERQIFGEIEEMLEKTIDTDYFTIGHGDDGNIQHLDIWVDNDISLQLIRRTTFLDGSAPISYSLLDNQPANSSPGHPDFDGTTPLEVECARLYININGYIYNKSRKNIIGHISIQNPDFFYDESGNLLTIRKIIDSTDFELVKKYRELQRKFVEINKQMRKKKINYQLV